MGRPDDPASAIVPRRWKFFGLAGGAIFVWHKTQLYRPPSRRQKRNPPPTRGSHHLKSAKGTEAVPILHSSNYCSGGCVSPEGFQRSEIKTQRSVTCAPQPQPQRNGVKG